MTLSNFNTQSLVTYVNQHQKQLHLLVVVLLSLYLLAFAASMVWRIIPEPSLSATPSVSSGTTSVTPNSQSGVNLRRLQQLNLFGDASAADQPDTTPVVTDAPETRLNLTLTGVVASSLEKAGAAIIENRGTQATYGLGDKIDGTNATLQQVFHDRVIIKNGAQHETLMLDGLDYKEANRRRQQRTARQPEPEEDTRTLSEDAVEATASLRNQPANFTDFISISPKMEDGQLVGYQVKPGKNPALFESAGLQAGDVIAQINGLDLTDLQQSQEALSELRNSQTIELTIIRDGGFATIYLDMPEPELE
ncbi:type II secretion system protein GspC [Alteromonas sp. ASW11-19]|uniref:Type II secretion system protein GspC n=1 Tax=Alteromonas salexigens TaxID=2982530 RepID=A0ABT2VKE3_9ALTE|nr:type II secretion system protein GspC [Alteromonas salexigens]MCU7553500.1 type II secretion system protein GspC [Alteromonas salexigens]